ncbi:MAG: metal-dependent hydrolase [Pirellulaceae bacterium]|nr:metal-dependent hydrolase [Pirellulaceae bacterium]
MADFKTHMLVSTTTGAVLAGVGIQAGISLDTCLVAGALCSVSGMLPDLDSDSGRPLREATALSAAVVPMMMVDRLQRLQLGHDTMVLISIGSYILIRFLMAEIFRRYTVHRGMWHSLPAAAICGMIAFLLIANEDIGMRIYKTVAVVLGFLSHLILDEIWSVDYRSGGYKFKQSFGTALKLWGNRRSANLVSYGLLMLSGIAVYSDQGFMARYHINPNVPHTVGELYASVKQRIDKLKEHHDGDASAAQAALAGPNHLSPDRNTVPTQNQATSAPGFQGLPAGNWPAPPNGWK